MRYSISVFIMVLCLVIGIPFVSDVCANKPTVTIDAPADAVKGSEITIKIIVDHSANSFLHYVNWASITINGDEGARWNFSAFDRPEGKIFSREIKHTVNAPIEIGANANCNIHGNKGPVIRRISIKE